MPFAVDRYINGALIYAPRIGLPCRVAPFIKLSCAKYLAGARAPAVMPEREGERERERERDKLARGRVPSLQLHRYDGGSASSVSVHVTAIACAARQ